MTGVGKDGTGFSPTVRRVLRIVRSQRAFKIMFPLGLASVALNVTGPLLLGRATDLALAGVVDPSTAQPAHVDLGPIVVVLLAAFIVHAVSGLCWILQGRQASTAVQRTAARLREDVEAKLSRLPVAYFDRVPRGELLSRTTNDIDNLVQALQQTISQLTNSVALIPRFSRWSRSLLCRSPRW